MKRNNSMTRAAVPGAANMKEFYRNKWGLKPGETLANKAKMRVMVENYYLNDCLQRMRTQDLVYGERYNSITICERVMLRALRLLYNLRSVFKKGYTNG